MSVVSLCACGVLILGPSHSTGARRGLRALPRRRLPHFCRGASASCHSIWHTTHAALSAAERSYAPHTNLVPGGDAGGAHDHIFVRVSSTRCTTEILAHICYASPATCHTPVARGRI